jgi:hypothetical protein
MLSGSHATPPPILRSLSITPEQDGKMADQHNQQADSQTKALRVRSWNGWQQIKVLLHHMKKKDSLFILCQRWTQKTATKCGKK